MTFKPILANILIFLLLALSPARGWWQPQTNSIKVSQNEAVMNFPSSITFTLMTSANSPIQLVNLRYGTNGRTCQPGFLHRNLKFSPAASLALSSRWQIQKEGLYLPPGVQVWWQWLIHTSDEQTLLTEAKTMTIQDPDHDWRSSQHGDIQVEWYEGDPDFGQALLEIATQSQARLASETGLESPERIHLLVYPDGDAIQAATLHLPEWTGGVAFPEFDTALVAAAPSQIEWARQVIPHEIAHLIISARIFNCLDAGLPFWVLEGFSKFAEGPLKDVQKAALLESLQSGSLPGLQNLVDHFPYEAGPASQAYLVSLAAVDYLLQLGGAQSFSRLLDQVQAGQNFDQSMLDIYGYQTGTLDQAWQAALGYGETPARLPTAPPEEPGSLSNKSEHDPNRGLAEAPGSDFSLMPATVLDLAPVGLALVVVGLGAGLAVMRRRAGRKNN